MVYGLWFVFGCHLRDLVPNYTTISYQTHLLAVLPSCQSNVIPTTMKTVFSELVSAFAVVFSSCVFGSGVFYKTFDCLFGTKGVKREGIRTNLTTPQNSYGERTGKE